MNRKSLDPLATATASFGPVPSNAWQRDAEGISLVRQLEPARPLRIGTDASTLEIDLARSLLIVVDMQNDFCHPQGWFAQKGVSMRATRRPIPILQQLLPAWRQTGAKCSGLTGASVRIYSICQPRCTSRANEQQMALDTASRPL